jgi:CheY-like chemotaxis protein
VHLIDLHMPEMDGFELAECLGGDSQANTATIMMLTSMDHRGHAARCRELGLSSYLIKPIAPLELFDAISQAAGHTAPSVPAAPSRRRHILLAEDNAINQRLAIRLLEKAGYVVTLAENGQEAVAAYQRQTFDAILMDVQMPDMSGFDATQQIRDIEQRNRRHTPIIAMTAHAMTGDRERCLAAGMDGYLTKPIDATLLFETLEEAVVSRR